MIYTEEFLRQYDCPNYRIIENSSGGGTVISIFLGMVFLIQIQKRHFGKR